MKELEAGPELDALIAEKVMGGTLIRCSLHGAKDGPPNCRQVHWPGGRVGHPPEYSTDIAAAWTVVERLASLNEDQFVRVAALRHGKWSAIVATEHASSETILGRSAADSAPLAICRAALLALRPVADLAGGG
jgi:hypothetical protein